MINNQTKGNTQLQSLSALKHLDISAVIFKPAPKVNIYLRTPTYRKRKSISLKGMTDSECY
jgi:hypothetical protein